MERYSKLRDKEVINSVDGKLLGCICDLVIDTACGAIIAIVVPSGNRWTMFCKEDKDIVIPWCKIKKIGCDVILVTLGCD